MMKPINQAQISFDSRSVNESFGRAAVAAFLTQLDPTVADLPARLAESGFDPALLGEQPLSTVTRIGGALST